ncbi:DEAD/DEAH box helicase [Salinicoccus roseus]|uniref:DEAD/DEAH box helicase n=1 Tax=Salinicoccus roseus TaxID=45670 RepID=UPI0035666DFB
MDLKIFKQQDLVLSVNENINPLELDLDEWDLYISKLCGDRGYQKEVIKQSIIYLASGRYKSLIDLATENYKNNHELQSRYLSLKDYVAELQLPNKLFANIDLATGTGKSYVMYGIAQIMLGLGIIDRVLVLCPSLTIESGLTKKFNDLSASEDLRKSIPESAVIKYPRIIDANITIQQGDICVENIHAVYEGTGSSISDSLETSGENTLVLNDESHHIFNNLQSVKGNTAEGKSIKKWKEFLEDPKYNFKYILGFTGTAYIDNEYFNDVIYRYSLRDAIEDRVVKNIEYVQKDDSITKLEKFQKIYQNHQNNKEYYSKVKPLSILITKDIEKAIQLKQELVEFLAAHEELSVDAISEKVLIVTSSDKHKSQLPKLNTVDDINDPTEWVVSVSMLTEGWDVKNVFQIVPWEDRAFNSKLLIAQVLGRGLRIPEEYISPQPKVTVFNHDSWSKNIRSLVEEVLEIETRIYSQVLKKGDRSFFNFSVLNLDYARDEKEISNVKEKNIYDYSRLEKEGIKLDSQVIETQKETIFESVSSYSPRSSRYLIKHETRTIQEVVDKIYEEFENRDWEGKVLKLGEEKYIQNSLPPREKIENIIKKSMQLRGIEGEEIIEKNVQKILQAFSTLLRKKKRSVVPTLRVRQPQKVNTKDIIMESTGIGNLRRGYTIFYSNNYDNEILSDNQKSVFNEILNDGSLPRNSTKEMNEFLFKTPLNLVFSSSEPERKFIESLCTKEIASQVSCWIKSRDRGFYAIEYSLKYGEEGSKTRKFRQRSFNPDFFIKIEKDGIEHFLVVEIKADKDDSVENKAKYSYAKEHFNRLNEVLKERNIKQNYIFHFLSPNGYNEFFEYIKSDLILKNQEIFRCELENMLED